MINRTQKRPKVVLNADNTQPYIETDIGEQSAPHNIIKPGVSIIIPTYNEVASAGLLVQRIHATFQKMEVPYEIILVDDHSTDDTVKEARKYSMIHRIPLRAFLKKGQRGKSFSLIEGFALARLPILGLIDADLQYPPEAFAEMYEALLQADIAVADRRQSYSDLDPQRGKLSNLFNEQVLSRFFHIDADVQSGMKLFYRETYFSFGLRPTPWSFDLDFLAQAKHAHLRIANIPITFASRHEGTSKVHPWRVGIQLALAALRLYLWLLVSPLVIPLMRFGIIPKYHRYYSHPDTLDGLYDDADLLQQSRAWLYNHALQTANEPYRHITATFAEKIHEPIAFHGEKIAAFTAIDEAHSAQRTFYLGQKIAIILFCLLWLSGFIFFTTPTLIFSISLVILFYTKNMFDTTRVAISTINDQQEMSVADNLIDELYDVPWPRYTILCPLYHEVAVVKQFVNAIQDLEYPDDRLQVLFLTEEDDDGTRDAIAAMQLPSYYEIVVVPKGKPQTKPRACNVGLSHATGDYIVIFDAEDIPDPRQLKKAVLAFAQSNAQVACVQAKLNFYNAKQNLLTRFFALEYTMWFDMLLPGMQHARMSLPLGGTSNHFQTSLLRQLGGWDPFNVTEDCDLGLRLAHEGLTTIVLDSVTMEEGNPNLRNWIRQRSRWIKGYLQTYLVHMRNPWRFFRRGMWREFSSLQFIIGGTPATFFVNPIMWGMLAIYIALRPLVAATYHILYPGPIFYLGVICFVFGNYLYICLAVLAAMKRKEYSLMKWALLLPIYWLLMSIAAVPALYQLIWNPHYWEKTQHGLHLKQQPPDAPVLDFATSTIRQVNERK